MTAPRPEAEPRERLARPILLTVDDDPTVSRAVARDLRRRYGADYRVVRADSGPEGLTFAPAATSPTGGPLLLVGNEVSGTVVAFRPAG